MDKIEIKTIQDIKDYVKSLDTPDNKTYQENSLLIMSCFIKAIEFIEENAKLRQPNVTLVIADANPHHCPYCSWQCTCTDQPCSCCSSNNA